MLKERKSKPSLIRPIRVFSLLRDRPLSFSHILSFSWTSCACSRVTIQVAVPVLVRA
jgi:hypothetical protein